MKIATDQPIRRVLSRAVLAVAAVVGVLAMLPGVSSGHRSRFAPRFVQYAAGARALNYDGEADWGQTTRDWPITLVFYDNAAVNKVKTRLCDTFQFCGTGTTEHEPYKVSSSAGIRSDADKGKKTQCDSSANDDHYRVYAPYGQSDRFFEPTAWGFFVVASTHLDHADGCGSGKQRFGYSEEVEKAIVALSGAIWRTHADVKRTYNYERLHVNTHDPNHIWQNDGYASTVDVP